MLVAMLAEYPSGVSFSRVIGTTTVPPCWSLSSSIMTMSPPFDMERKIMIGSAIAPGTCLISSGESS
ncbi:hypothetical protein M7784_00775 [Desulfovibrio aminophilus]|nr:hypothetical protein [Desulfovibrio aminophilus]MCM0753783.1 hypothetical protein [Desulfovibrio aminophilus]